MFELNIPSEVWSTIIVLVLFALYPRIVNSTVEKGKVRSRKLLLVIGFGILGFTLFLSYQSVFGTLATSDDSIAFDLMLIVMFCTSAYLIGEGGFVKGYFDDTKIVFFSPWRGKKECYWNSLKRVQHGWLSGNQILVFENGDKIPISTFLLGYKELMVFISSLGIEVDI